MYVVQQSMRVCWRLTIVSAERTMRTANQQVLPISQMYLLIRSSSFKKL